MTETRLGDVLNLIDAANARDPNQIEVDGKHVAAELLYGKRMSDMLSSFCPNAGEHLQIACRAQHIERWKSPRASYPEGRTGYLKWRADLKRYHANRVADLMQQAGLHRGRCKASRKARKQARHRAGSRSASSRGCRLSHIPEVLC